MLERESAKDPLQTAVHRRLTELTRSVENAEDERAVELARGEIPALAEALRAVLAGHGSDARGRCPRCRRGFFRRRVTPCRAYLAAQLALGEPVPPTPRRRHRRAAV